MMAERSSGGQSQLWKGRLLVVAAAVMWSTSGFFAKAPIFSDWPIETRGVLLAFWRATFAIVVLGTMVREVRWSWKFLPMVATFAAMNWSYLSALVYCEPTLAIWLQYTSPVWVFMISWLLFRDQPSWRDWLLLGFAALGVGVILRAQLWGASTNGVSYGLMSGVFFAGVIVSLRWLREYDAAWLVFLNHLATAVLFAPVLISTGVYPAGQQWVYLFCFGTLQMGIPYVLFARALRSVSGHEASGITLLEPVLVPVWVFAAWHGAADYEAPAWTTIVGAVLILIGLLARYVGSGKPQTAAD